MAILDTASFTEPGLYLSWSDGNSLALTRTFIASWTEAMLDDPDRIPASVRAATAYRPCDICPERERAAICHAIMPVLPFTASVDAYMSYDSVTAAYRETAGGAIGIVETTMQEALKFIAILSLTQYCEVGRKYGRYFQGINPLMSPPGIAAAIYPQIYMDAGGDVTKVGAIIGTIRDEFLLVVRCQMERLRLICTNDALLNAFVSTYNVIELLFAELENCLSRSGSNIA